MYVLCGFPVDDPCNSPVNKIRPKLYNPQSTAVDHLSFPLLDPDPEGPNFKITTLKMPKNGNYYYFIKHFKNKFQLTVNYNKLFIELLFTKSHHRFVKLDPDQQK